MRFEVELELVAPVNEGVFAPGGVCRFSRGSNGRPAAVFMEARDSRGGVGGRAGRASRTGLEAGAEDAMAAMQRLAI